MLWPARCDPHNMSLQPLIELVCCLRDDIEPRRITNDAELEQYLLRRGGNGGHRHGDSALSKR